MKATEILMDEHTVILRVIATLETAAQRVEQGQAVRPGFFVDAADFIKGFADGCHHKKEEGVLFKAMADSGMSVQAGPIAVMLMEHEQGRTFTRAMREAAEHQVGDESARQALIASARGYAALLTQHIAKENGILFPMADRVVPPDRQAQVAKDFEHIEHKETGAGVHEKYLALAESLEKEMQD
jgi:hemerythrin-like domain-containing protein